MRTLSIRRVARTNRRHESGTASTEPPVGRATLVASAHTPLRAVPSSSPAVYRLRSDRRGKSLYHAGWPHLHPDSVLRPRAGHRRPRWPFHSCFEPKRDTKSARVYPLLGRHNAEGVAGFTGGGEWRPRPSALLQRRPEREEGPPAPLRQRQGQPRPRPGDGLLLGLLPRLRRRGERVAPRGHERPLGTLRPRSLQRTHETQRRGGSQRRGVQSELAGGVQLSARPSIARNSI
ncbi:uncharacterized protein LOC125034784 [Penaeus chinensis]|uniref:uncharacterized protein LOC125034784 n=1 Tax=Penaeus chinensis TaxID=139456 RepID=UPI001FB5F852|nr:uncharacterized protein LOC125034784 [Penaeus chinensis]